ncbi:MAG: aminopeptidase P family protein [Candidatus Tectomicrobia bacterium]|uniref:Aminopeptidase P family protein n=1 Tax=Tectimicrobiota bacterium TaxID=2528274 RepID=A0A932I2W4_UNCTE|nr:aminopeptidase P family protein [Candidatus Tectomicrobia bacterium]
MEKEGVDLLLASSKDNVAYLLGGYRFFFFAHKDAIGVSRYLPLLGYRRGSPEKAFYLGNSMESWQQEWEPLWVPEAANSHWHSEKAAKDAAGRIRKLGLGKGAIAVEKGFLPADAYLALQEELPDARLVDAHLILEELRAVKRPGELALLRQASEAIIDCMVQVMTTTPAGATTLDIAERVRKEEVQRGLHFEYCLTAAGPGWNRAPSARNRWERGRALSLDSGGNLHGYLGDLARMAVMGEPTPLMEEVMGEVEAIQMAARSAVRPGATGAEIFEKALAEQAKCPHKGELVFVAHGMGIIQHEAPRLTSAGVVPYPGPYESRPLEAGMVLSIETDLKNAEAGFVKIEDTVVVTPAGWEAYGDRARGWTVCAG